MKHFLLSPKYAKEFGIIPDMAACEAHSTLRTHAPHPPWSRCFSALAPPSPSGRQCLATSTRNRASRARSQGACGACVLSERVRCVMCLQVAVVAVVKSSSGSAARWGWAGTQVRPTGRDHGTHAGRGQATRKRGRAGPERTHMIREEIERGKIWREDLVGRV